MVNMFVTDIEEELKDINEKQKKTREKLNLR